MRADRIGADVLTFCFLRHPGPHSLGFEAIEPDRNFAGNVG
jgi:hypothetical protein